MHHVKKPLTKESQINQLIYIVCTRRLILPFANAGCISQSQSQRLHAESPYFEAVVKYRQIHLFFRPWLMINGIGIGQTIRSR